VPRDTRRLTDGNACDPPRLSAMDPADERRWLLLLLQLLEDFSLIREAPHLFLREHGLSVEDHVENPAAARRQGGVRTQILLQLGRQTGGPGEIPSLGAVADLDVHGFLLATRVYRYGEVTTMGESRPDPGSRASAPSRASPRARDD